MYQEQMNENEKAIQHLSRQFAADGHYGWTWHSNIAACIMDEGVPHKKANHAAARFMKLAFGYDSMKQDEWKFFEKIWSDISEAEKLHAESGNAEGS